VDAVEVQHCDPTELPHRDGEVDVDHAIHGRSPDWDREFEVVAHRKRDVDFFGIESDAARDKRDLVESVRAASPPADPYLEARLLPGCNSAGFEPALIQGVFTPMVAGFGRLYGMLVLSTRRLHFL
jgi:hypothetical protein